MVNIELPLHIGLNGMSTIIETLGIQLQYSETPIQLQTFLVPDMITLFQNSIQYKEGVPQDTVNVRISNRESLILGLVQIFKHNAFVTDMSVEQPLFDHLSEGLAVELSRHLGLNAIASTVQIPTSDQLFRQIAESMLNDFDSSSQLRRYLFEQYFYQSPERFYPGKNEVYLPIPFASGDVLSFFLTLRFHDAYINGKSSLPLTNFLNGDDLPVVKFVVRFSFL